MSHKGKPSSQVQAAIRGVLHQDWDPIPGAPLDEYDGQIGAVYRILVGSRSETELVLLLRTAETGLLGRPTSSNAELQLVARRLLEIQVT